MNPTATLSETVPASSASGVKHKPFGYDLQVGVAAVSTKARVGFTFVKRSKECETQAADDKLGQLTISFPV